MSKLQQNNLRHSYNKPLISRSCSTLSVDHRCVKGPIVKYRSEEGSVLMNGTVKVLFKKRIRIIAMAIFSAIIMVVPPPVRAQAPEPVVAIHVSEKTQALDPGQWWSSWHYFVMPDSLKEALRSDGTPFIEVTDVEIEAGNLLAGGSPKYPILISLAAEAIADDEIAPLLEYVNAGGILFVGSSAFTRNPDGSTRADFALASELGLHMVNPDSLSNWYENRTFTKDAEHRLVTDIPTGTLNWRMPLSAEEISSGTSTTNVSTNHVIHGNHWVFQVTADSGTTVIANGDSGPLLATRQYGKGNFIYHGDAQPLIGHGGYDPVHVCVSYLPSSNRMGLRGCQSSDHQTQPMAVRLQCGFHRPA